MNLRLGLIGVGYWGANLFRVFRSLDGVSLTAVADLDGRARANVADVVTVRERPEDLWTDPELDAVLVATPPSTHHALAREVLSAGKHCWVEKPMAVRPAEAAELVQLAEARRRMLFVDETFLYDPLIQRARDWIERGRLGRLYHLSFERLGMGRIRRDSDVWWNSAPHDLAILRYLVPAELESIRVERFSYLQPGLADVCVGTVCLAGDVSAHVYLSWLSPVKTASVVVVGSDGMLRYEGRFGQRSLTFFDYAIDDPQRVTSNVVPIPSFAATEVVAGGEEEPLALAAEAFVDAIRTGRPAASDGRNSLRVIELLAAADVP